MPVHLHVFWEDSPPVLRVHNLSKSYGEQLLFAETGFTIGQGERVGVVGRNGHGKTTLFRLILGEESADAGTIETPKKYTFGYVSQHLKFSHSSVREEAASALPKNQDGWVETHRAEAILSGLGFAPPEFDMPPEVFSGGLQVRVNLAKALLADPDMLLLDEPTNYLDITSTRWLERFLRSWQRELLLITHDADFMNKVCTHTLAIHRQGFRKTQGPTGKLYQQILQEEEMQAKTAVNETKKREAAERFITRFRASATRAKAVQSRVKALERTGIPEKLAHVKDLEFQFTPASFPGKIIMEAENLCFGYKEDQLLIKGINLHVGKHDRIGIVGPNGRGKTTLLRLLAGELTPQSGTIVYRPNAQVGHFGQTNINRLSPEKTVEEEIYSAIPNPTRGRARNLAGRMMFEGDAAMKKTKVLSGGERSRVLLAQILARPANLLLLDEPTNHLDMQSIETFTEAVAIFEGAVVLITHSESLLRQTVNKLIVFDRSTVTVFDGTYAEFLKKTGWSTEAPEDQKTNAFCSDSSETGENKKTARRRRAQEAAERKKKTKPIEDRIKKREQRIALIETKETELHTLIVTASEKGEGNKIKALSLNLSDVETERDLCYTALESDYEELSQLLANE